MSHFETLRTRQIASLLIFVYLLWVVLQMRRSLKALFEGM
jgi:hypothetical protein